MQYVKCMWHLGSSRRCHLKSLNLSRLITGYVIISLDKSKLLNVCRLLPT